MRATGPQRLSKQVLLAGNPGAPLGLLRGVVIEASSVTQRIACQCSKCSRPPEHLAEHHRERSVVGGAPLPVGEHHHHRRTSTGSDQEKKIMGAPEPLLISKTFPR
jgi:hypothetical protein